MGTLPDFRTFPQDDLLGLFTCQRGYPQGYKTSKIASVAICGRSCHIMPVLFQDIACNNQHYKMSDGYEATFNTINYRCKTLFHLVCFVTTKTGALRNCSNMQCWYILYTDSTIFKSDLMVSPGGSAGMKCSYLLHQLGL